MQAMVKQAMDAAQLSKWPSGLEQAAPCIWHCMTSVRLAKPAQVNVSTLLYNPVYGAYP